MSMRRSTPTSITDVKRPFPAPTLKRSFSFFRSTARVSSNTQLASSARAWLGPRSFAPATVDVAVPPIMTASSAASVLNSMVLPPQPSALHLCTPTASGCKRSDGERRAPACWRAPRSTPWLRARVAHLRARAWCWLNRVGLLLAPNWRQGSIRTGSSARHGPMLAPHTPHIHVDRRRARAAETGARPPTLPPRPMQINWYGRMKNRKGARRYRGTARRPILAFVCVGETTSAILPIAINNLAPREDHDGAQRNHHATTKAKLAVLPCLVQI